MSTLFNNDPGSCGPSNPLLSLSKHTNNTDNSFSQQNKRPITEQLQQLFNTSNRLNRVDHRLDQEFQQFTSHRHVQPQHFQPLQNLPIQPQPQPQTQHSFPSTSSASNQWSQDFSKLSLNGNNYNTLSSQQQQQQNVSALRFNNTTNSWNQEFNQQQQPSQHLHHNIISTNLLANPQQHQFQHQLRHLTEHEELHQVAADLGKQQVEYETIFDQLEQEISLQKNVQEEAIKTQIEYDKDKFAETAKLVANAMSQKTQKANLMSKKFENSNFLKLMNQVSEKSVVINDEGDAFVLNKLENQK